MRKVGRFPESPGRTRFLSNDERARLLRECKPDLDLYTVVVLALSTGMRQSEIRFLQWGQVDLELGQIHLETTKSGHYRIVPLVGQALELLWARPHV